MKVTIYRETKCTFSAVCWYAKQRAECDDSTIEMFGGDNINLSINGPVTIGKITITPISKGEPVSGI